ncbi:hypothetical protein Barb4_03812 [Bacteroidales bacterium Barb4]|nr:hypothetical protein Barb4_03812 [Bacteroidales bacterium Barb4]
MGLKSLALSGHLHTIVLRELRHFFKRKGVRKEGGTNASRSSPYRTLWVRNTDLTEITRPNSVSSSCRSHRDQYCA